MTQALKVKKTLSASYSPCDVIKLDSSMSKKGCSYGVKFDCINFSSVENTLLKSQIAYNQILNIEK